VRQGHSQCSEPFYRTTVLDQIAADPKAGMEEKRNMMEILRRLEERQVEGDEAFAGLEEEDEEDELRAKLEGWDLGGCTCHISPIHQAWMREWV